MTKKYFFVLLVGLGCGPLGLAQKFTVRGQVLDSLSQPMASATVMLLSAQDSSLTNFALTGAAGVFQLNGVARSSYILKITFVGYKTYGATLAPPAQGDMLDLGVIVLAPARTKLDEVVIEAGKPPVVVKKDTIEFNATTFKTNPNATVEDLLKKLPGVEVDNDGTIRAQGEEVERVMVDGKEFFGNDPKIATRNLPADAIDKVQVFDKKSDQTVFSGVDDGQREKTINLALKEEKRNGAFGNVQGGAGTDDRFQAKASINRFRKGQQLSVLGMANNTNDQGFSVDDYMSFTGGAQKMMRGGAVRMEFNADNANGVPLNFGGRTSGLMTNYAGGANVNEDFTSKTALNASYFFNYLDHDLRQSTERVNYVPSGDVTYNQQNRQHNTNGNHRVNTTLDHRLDSMNSLKWTTVATYNYTNAAGQSVGGNRAGDGTLQNSSESATHAEGYSVNLNTTLLWRHKFARKGRNFSAQVQWTTGNSDRSEWQDALNTFYGDETQTSEVHQQGQQQSGSYMLHGTLTYTEPLGKRKYLEASYSLRQNVNEVDKKVYDEVGESLVPNAALSNLYTSDYRYQRAGLSVRINRSAYQAMVGGVFQQTSLQGDLRTLQQSLSKNYRNVLPVARFGYDFSDTRHLTFDYETSVQEPTVQQLQPVIDNSDQLNWYVGNPALRPAYAHNARFNFMLFDPGTFVNFFAFVDGTYTRNAIVTSQQYTVGQVRLSKPVNVDYGTRLMADATFGFPVRKIGSRFSVSGNITRQGGVNMVEGEETDIDQQTLGMRLRYDYRFKEIFDASLGANLRRQSTDYTLEGAVDQLYFNKTFTAEANLSFMKNYQVSSSLEYLVYESKTTGYKQSIPLWNVSLSRFLLKAKSGELKFSVSNLLDKNTGVSQTADANYFERQVSNSLGRYYMVSFVYALNKQLNPMYMRPGGGVKILRQG